MSQNRRIADWMPDGDPNVNQAIVSQGPGAPPVFANLGGGVKNLITVGPVDPGSMATGDLWFNTTTDTLYVAHNGTWQKQVSGVQLTNIGATAPATPSPGDMWYDTSADALKIFENAAWQLAVELPDAVVVSTGAADAGKRVETNAQGLIDDSLFHIDGGSY